MTVKSGIFMILCSTEIFKSSFIIRYHIYSYKNIRNRKDGVGN